MRSTGDGDAHPDTVHLLRSAGVPGVIHCFTAGPDEARAYAALGLYVSFSGIIAFKTAGAIRAAVKEVPLDRILMETDCPYLAPVPMRGRRNEPAFLPEVLKALARAIGRDELEIATATTQNARRLFWLPEARPSPYG